MFGKIAIFGFAKRPLVGEQNTGRDAYQRPFGVGTVSPNGWGGFGALRSLSPLNISTFNPAVVTPASVTGLGNDTNTNPPTVPLSVPQPTINLGTQF